MRNRPVVLAVTGITALLATGAGIALAGAPEPVRAAAFSAPTTPSAPAVPTESRAASTPGGLSAAEAADVALRHVGGGRVTEVEREVEHGRREWKVEVVRGGREHDVRVDAATGAVTRTDADRDD